MGKMLGVVMPLLAVIGGALMGLSQADNKFAAPRRLQLLLSGIILSLVGGGYTAIANYFEIDHLMSAVKESAREVSENLSQTKTVLEEARRSAKASESTLQRTERVLGISNRTLSAAESAKKFVSGGETFPQVSVIWVLPGKVGFSLSLIEEAPLTEPSMRRMDEAVEPTQKSGPPNTLFELLVDLSPPVVKPVTGMRLRRHQWVQFGGFYSAQAHLGEYEIPNSDRFMIKVTSSARNGVWEQVMAFRKVGENKWAVRSVIGGHFRTTGRSGVLVDRASPDYPSSERHLQIYPFRKHVNNFFPPAGE